jgi:hypothetical protein
MAEEANRAFDERDVDLLVRVLSHIPNGAEVAYATKRARTRAKYPIADHAGLAALLDDGKVARFRDREVTVDSIRRYVPKEFFPIDDEQDFIAKVLIAFDIAEVEHSKQTVPRPRR